MTTLQAITRLDIADYVRTLVWIYTILILVRILLTWVPRMPYNPVLNHLVRFIEDVTEPYLTLFRKIIPPIGMIDISPIAAIFALGLIGQVIASAIAG
ncbi:MAG: YggT family protein [Actinobacteria bacterium]|nr:YggT family protein [Actinomycetota bacterium]